MVLHMKDDLVGELRDWCEGSCFLLMEAVLGCLIVLDVGLMRKGYGRWRKRSGYKE